MLLEEKLEPIFHPDSYGYRPGRSAHDALAVARKRCWNKDWVLDLDVRAFFDSVGHDLLMKAVAHHTDERWVLLYIERWLKAPMTMRDGTTAPREMGTPQGSPISPLLANLFMHYAFDKWMDREHSRCPFERYADDVVIHCDTEQQARQLWAGLVERLGSLGLELHPDKTKIVYCKDTNRRDEAEHTSFDFLGYTFPGSPGPWPTRLLCELLTSHEPHGEEGDRRTDQGLAPQPSQCNGPCRTRPGHHAQIRGWFNYYGAFYRSELYAIAARIDEHLVRWAMQKFKRLRGQPTKAWRWLDAARQREPQLSPTGTPRLNPTPDCGSRMTGDCHVTVLREREGRFPPATHHGDLGLRSGGGHLGLRWVGAARRAHFSTPCREHVKPFRSSPCATTLRMVSRWCIVLRDVDGPSGHDRAAGIEQVGTLVGALNAFDGVAERQFGDLAVDALLGAPRPERRPAARVWCRAR